MEDLTMRELVENMRTYAMGMLDDVGVDLEAFEYSESPSYENFMACYTELVDRLEEQENAD